MIRNIPFIKWEEMVVEGGLKITTFSQYDEARGGILAIIIPIQPVSNLMEASEDLPEFVTVRNYDKNGHNSTFS